MFNALCHERAYCLQAEMLTATCSQFSKPSCNTEIKQAVNKEQHTEQKRKK
jgi:hypothetical protein